MTIRNFGAILNERRGEGFVAVDAYQQRYDDAQQAFTNAKTPTDYAHVSDLASAQTQALLALWPAYEQAQTLRALIASLHGAGVNTRLAQRFHAGLHDLYPHRADRRRPPG